MPKNQLKFLIIDDDKESRLLIERILRRSYPKATIYGAARGNHLLDIAQTLQPDVIILDWVLKGGAAGISLCEKLKTFSKTQHIPIILVSGQRRSEDNLFESLASGANIFLAKPFKVEKFSGCVKALLQKAQFRKNRRRTINIGGLLLSQEPRSAIQKGKGPLPLSKKFFHLLWLLAGNSPKPVSVKHLIRHVWKNMVRDREVAVAVCRLKKYLKTSRVHIETIPKLGYRLTAKT